MFWRTFNIHSVPGSQNACVHLIMQNALSTSPTSKSHQVSIFIEFFKFSNKKSSLSRPKEKLAISPWKIKTKFCVFSKQLQAGKCHTAKGRNRSTRVEPMKASIASYSSMPDIYSANTTLAPKIWRLPPTRFLSRLAVLTICGFPL